MNRLRQFASTTGRPLAMVSAISVACYAFTGYMGSVDDDDDDDDDNRIVSSLRNKSQATTTTTTTTTTNDTAIRSQTTTQIPSANDTTIATTTLPNLPRTTPHIEVVDDDDDEIMIHGQVLERHLHQPKVPYPLWDYNWDDRMDSRSTLEAHLSGRADAVKGVTRHVLLVRHGQYDETFTQNNDAMRRLTPLGKTQARETGKRLRRMLLSNQEETGRETTNKGLPKITVKSSSMKRARETAEIIVKELNAGITSRRDRIKLERPDPRLDEALPAANVPPRRELSDEASIREIDDHHGRIERAFRATCFRGDQHSPPSTNDDSDSDGRDSQDSDVHEFHVVVCHANVIRYFWCRALQLPPEAWLRTSIFNCSLTYLVFKPNGLVTARMLGDVGHLKVTDCSFSMNHGFVW